MDVAYDSIQEEALSPKLGPKHDDDIPADPKQETASGLNTEFREAYKAISESPWATKLSGFLGTVKKQGVSYYEEARKELSAASGQAAKGGPTDLISFTNVVPVEVAGKDSAISTETSTEATTPKVSPEAPESLPADIVKEAESMLSKFRAEAAVRLKQIEKAEDAADEALLRFGTNIRNFLRDAVTIAPPSMEDDSGIKRDVLFESKDAEGRRVVHATRFDAQLHVIHSTISSFTHDPASDEYAKWKGGFDADKKTDTIAKDLGKFDELRAAMDKLVPEQVPYVDFWTRYYFLRHVIETEEQKRRELLKGTLAEQEEVSWDDDDDDEEQLATPSRSTVKTGAADRASTPTNSGAAAGGTDMLRPYEPRRSNEHSVADSESSYDIVSRGTSRGPGTPKDEKDLSLKKTPSSAAEGSDEDWE